MDRLRRSATVQAKDINRSTSVIYPDTPAHALELQLLVPPESLACEERAKLGIQSGQSVAFGGIDRDMGGKQCCSNSERPTSGDLVCDLNSCLQRLFWCRCNLLHFSDPIRFFGIPIRDSPMNLLTNGFVNNCGWLFGPSRTIRRVARLHIQ